MLSRQVWKSTCKELNDCEKLLNNRRVLIPEIMVLLHFEMSIAKFKTQYD